ncbi:hypothetical protein Dimus_032747 [Dionaea muscipula]
MLGSSDFMSLSEASSDGEDEISTYGGHAESILSSLNDSIGRIDDLLTFDRRFMPGDVVSLAMDPSGQMGKILNVDVLVDLENVLGKTIKDVNTKDIQRVRSISVGDQVICGPWLGRVNKVVDSISIVFDDGSRCELTETGQGKLLPVSANILDDDSLYPYYPGQRVKVCVSSVSMSSGWLCGMSKRNHQEGTIYSIEVGSVYIDWIACAMVGLSQTIPPPPILQHPKNLTLLSCFSHANWQLGDCCILQSESVNERKIPERGGVKGTDFNSNLEEMFVIVKRRTKVDVMWQDDSRSFGLDSHSLLPTGIVNAHDFFPQQFVLEKNKFEDMKVSASQRWGLVQSLDANERTAKVRWMLIDENTTDSDEWMEETVSAYELIEHPDFSYSLGDIVFSLKDSHSVNQADVLGTGDVAAMRCFLSCIGHVIGFEDGNIKVQWASGMTSKVGPYKIFRVERDDGSVATHGPHHEGNISWLDTEMISDEKESWHLKAKDVLVTDMDGGNRRGYNEKSNFFGLPRAAIGFFNGIAASFFGSHRFPQQILEAPAADEGKDGSLKDQVVVESCDISKDLQGSEDEVMKKPESSVILSSYTKISEHFKQFDIVSDCTDHHFANGAGGRFPLSQIKKSWSKKVQQEWNILEQNLPEMIYVRIYDERMDLLRAAIVGAVGTPYHNGLFFFDIFLPPGYPNEPPLVHYRSGGLRLNPNLYESGRVCLSLLNTWTGTGSEVWNPGSSTILQVLISLQALVLNDKPYFNEAGYDGQLGRAEGEKNSISYNENAFLVNCKSIIYLLRNPPKHFEGLVEEHFKRRGEQILSACKAYMEEDAPIGSGSAVANGARIEPAVRIRNNSTGFKIMLAKLFPKLVEAFSDQGFNCGQFSDHVT